MSELRLFFFQHFENLGNTFALSIVRNGDFAVACTRLLEIRKVRMLQRLSGRYSVARIEAQHASDEIQQRPGEQGRSSMLCEMLQQAVFQYGRRHELRANISGGVAEGGGVEGGEGGGREGKEMGGWEEGADALDSNVCAGQLQSELKTRGLTHTLSHTDARSSSVGAPTICPRMKQDRRPHEAS